MMKKKIISMLKFFATVIIMTAAIIGGLYGVTYALILGLMPIVSFIGSVILLAFGIFVLYAITSKQKK